MKRTHEEAMEDEPRTVMLNVGGSMYEVSKTLLSKHPDSMLYRMTSTTWKKEGDKAPIFIERDGDRFRYVLDYMRDSKITLSGCQDGITKLSMMEELAYYVLPVDEKCIIWDVPMKAIVECTAGLKARLKEVYETEKAATWAQRRLFDVKYVCAKVAYACALRSIKTSSKTIKFSIVGNVSRSFSFNYDELKNDIHTKLDHNVISNVRSESLESHKHHLDEALTKYGMHCVAYEEETVRFTHNDKRMVGRVNVEIEYIQTSKDA